MKKCFSILLPLFVIALHSQSVSLATNFGTVGFATIPMNSTGYPYIYSKIQPDGKILVSGTRNNGTNEFEQFVARYNANGNPDLNFGVNGFYIINNSIINPYGVKFFLLNSGKIICISSDPNAAEIIKLNSNGTIDAAFGTNGKLSFGIFFNECFLDADEDLYYGSGSGSNDLTKINTITGATVGSFGTNGQIFLPYSFDDIHSFQNGKFIVSTFPDIGPDYSVALMRCNIDGSIDTTFGNNGILRLYTTQNQEEFDDVSENVAVDASGDIYVNENNFISNTATLRKFDTAGILQTSFGNSGIALLPSNAFGNSIELHSGKIYLTGIHTSANDYNTAILRYTTDGNLDTTFNNSGFYYEEGNSLLELTYSLNFNNDGSLIVAGQYEDGDFNKTFLAKYIDGSLSVSSSFDKNQLSYNNPVGNILTVDSEKPIKSIELYNVEGKSLLFGIGNSIATEKVPSGIYFAKITSDNDEFQTIKIIKN